MTNTVGGESTDGLTQPKELYHCLKTLMDLKLVLTV